MIKTLQKKFIFTAMTAVTVLLLIVLGALNVFNAVSSNRQSFMLIEELGKQDLRPYNAPLNESSQMVPQPPSSSEASPFSASGFSGEQRRRGFLDEPMNENARLSAVYFTVDLDERRRVIHVDTNHIADVSDDEATEMVLSLGANRDRGSAGNYRYGIIPLMQGGYRVVFLDNTTRHAAVLRVALISLMLGLLGWALMLSLVLLLSRRAIRPIAKNMQRQKQFVTDAGHDLKTPLAIILANLDAMELRSGENKYSSNIRTQTVRLSELVKKLLMLARMDELSAAEHREQLDFSSLCEESFSMFRENAELRQIGFNLSCEPGIQVQGDRSLLAQLCSILGDNAVKYCSSNGQISVSLQREGAGCCLRVSNSVSESPELDRLFDRFYRSDSSRNQKEGGFGIGLSAASEIVRLHKGKISAEFDENASALVFVVHL